MNAGGTLRGGITLAVIAAICTTLVAATWTLTQARIAANEKARLERSLQPALDGVSYDSDLLGSRRVLAPPHGLPGSEDAVVYRVFSADAPAAALFVVSASGYTGPIRLLVGVDTSGTVTGVRVLEHRETPGLGDGIEVEKSDWVRQFTGRSLSDPDLTGWAIRRDGGEFDQLTGASVTPRAVVNAVRDTLLYFEADRERVFMTTQSKPQDGP